MSRVPEPSATRFMGTRATEQSIFLPDFDPSTITQINNGTYDWTQLPRWANSIDTTAYHLKQRRTIIERLCEDPTGDQDAADIGLDMLKCSKTFPCGSPFCPHCRHIQQEKRAKKARNKFAARNYQDLAGTLYELTRLKDDQ